MKDSKQGCYFCFLSVAHECFGFKTVRISHVSHKTSAISMHIFHGANSSYVLSSLQFLGILWHFTTPRTKRSINPREAVRHQSSKPWSDVHAVQSVL